MPEDNEKQNLKESYTNKYYKCYVFMISLVSLSKHTYNKIQFTILLIA